MFRLNKSTCEINIAYAVLEKLNKQTYKMICTDGRKGMHDVVHNILVCINNKS